MVINVFFRSGFLETGVERIVDQVVNPKINSVFLPTIEDISYKFLGIEKPKVIEQPPLPPPLPPTHSLPNEFGVSTNGLTFNLGINNILPNDLEAVSPESDRCNANKSLDSSVQSDDAADHMNTSIESGNTEQHADAADKSMCDDFESPAFEPLEGRASSAMSLVNDDEDGDNSKISAISGLTSQDSIESCNGNFVPEQPTYSIDDLSRIPPPPPPLPPPPPPPEDVPPAPKSEPLDTSDEQLHHDQNSALSQVSSNSRLSIVTSDSKSFSMPGDHCDEAQMPKFNENSSNSHNANAGNVASQSTDPSKERKPLLTSFDIKQDEIMFEGTRRHSICLDIKAEAAEQANNAPRPPSPSAPIPEPPPDSPNPPPPPSDHPDSDEVKNESFCSTSLITSETKFMSLNDEPLEDESEGITVPAIDAASTVDMEFKFEEPAIDGASPKDRSRDASSHKSRRRDRSSGSKSHHSGNRDKEKSREHSEKDSTDREKHSSTSKQRHGSSNSSKDGSSSRNSSSSHRRDDKSTSKPSSSAAHSSSSSKHHSSSSHHRHHHSSSSNKDRSSSSKSSSSGSNHKRSRSDKPASSEDRSNRKSSSDRQGNRTDKKSEENENGDDHFSEKQTERRRSNDSNDGNNQPHPAPMHPTTDPVASAHAPTATSSDHNSNGSTSTMDSSVCDQAALVQSLSYIISPAESDEDFVTTQLPVVVDDQILNGCQEINLEMLISQETSDPVLSSIQQTLSELHGSGARSKKPKVASNIFEARKLMKVRKQIERDEKKRMEQAIVLAKKYISTNSALASSLGMSDNQGVELEFACVTSSASPAPSISSPNKTVKHQPQRQETLATSSLGSDDDEEFLGFDCDTAVAKDRAITFIQHTEHIFADCAEFLRNHSDYSRSIYLFEADKQMAKAFSDMVVGDVWQYSKNAKRQAVVLRPIPADLLINPIDAIHSEANSPNKFDRKRHSESSTSASDNNNSSSGSSSTKTRKTQQIKYAATIQMTTVRGAGDEDTFDEEEEEDHGFAKNLGPNDEAVDVSEAIHISPTPSDQSFSSKENSFVPKIKKAVSRSIAHNTTMNANMACVVARKLFIY